MRARSLSSSRDQKLGIAALPVDCSDVVAEQSSVIEQTSQNLNSESQPTKSNAHELVLLKKPLHRLITVQFISKFMDGLQCVVYIPGLCRATFVASIQSAQKRHQLR